MTEEKEEKKITVKLPKVNIWMVFALILIAAIGFLFYTKSITGRFIGLSAEDAVDKAIKWISNYFQANGQNVSIKLINITEESGLYKFSVEIFLTNENFTGTYYVTKDGKLFIPNPIDISQNIFGSRTEFDAPDTEKPEVNLFVMAFCPYGMQAENYMKPVVDLFGEKINITIRFIASVQGTTVDSVRSLHGINEAKEDLRQICIQKYYNRSVFWNYLMEINSICSSNYNNDTALENCWKASAQKFGIDTNLIETCAYGSEGIDLLKIDEQLVEQYGVTGSPTLIINGAVYNGARNSESFKQAICSGFITPPAECNQTLSSPSSSISGTCG